MIGCGLKRGWIGGVRRKRVDRVGEIGWVDKGS